MLYVLLAVLAGMMLPLEFSTNTQLTRHLGHPIHASLCAFIIASLSLAVVSLVLTRSLPSMSTLAQAPAWTLLGGFVGAAFVTLCIMASGHTGALAFVLAMLAGQLIVSAALDHYGWLGNAVRPMTLARGVGLVLVVLGVYLIQRQ